MNQTSEPVFSLRGSDDDSTPPALTAVRADGRIEGVLFQLTLRQTYRNLGTETLEVVYSFPLAADTVLLGLAAEIDGRRLEGQVLPRAAAEARYEEALAQGDAPVLLEVAGAGIHTASIGHLLPGQQAVLEVRTARLLAFEQGRLRLAIPTTIAPRHGEPARQGLHPHQVPPHTLTAGYDLDLELTVSGSLARGAIECPSHAHSRRRDGDAVRLELAPGATLDRDVVVILTPAEPLPGLLLHGHDAAAPAAPALALATFALPPGRPRDSLALRLLVDCSGSMNGDSIASARQALQGVLAELHAGDEVSLSRFGDSVSHVVAPGRCDSAQRARLHEAIEATAAGMGDTEMRAALASTFHAWPQARRGADVLVLTDGEVWASDALAAAARGGGHRVFVIGLGTAPAESVLRALAEATGGACEFATPGEPLRAAARRMLQRLRQAPQPGLQVDWGAAPAWQLPVPDLAFGGDTVFALAGFAPGQAPAGPVRLLVSAGADAGAGPGREIARTAAVTPCDGDGLARIAAARRLSGLPEAEALALALDHQLVGPLTHCVLVHQRPDAGQPEHSARLQRTAQMLAAGWGGAGTVQQPAAGPSLRALMARVAGLLARGVARERLAEQAARWPPPEPLRRVADALQRAGVQPWQGWLLLALWVAQRGGREGDPATAALLFPSAVGIDDACRGRAWGIFERLLGHLPSDLGLPLPPTA